MNLKITRIKSKRNDRHRQLLWTIRKTLYTRIGYNTPQRYLQILFINTCVRYEIELQISIVFCNYINRVYGRKSIVVD